MCGEKVWLNQAHCCLGSASGLGGVGSVSHSAGGTLLLQMVSLHGKKVPATPMILRVVVWKTDYEHFTSMHLPQWMFYQGLHGNQAVAAGIYIVTTVLAQVLGRDVASISSTHTAQNHRKYKALVEVADFIFHYLEEETVGHGPWALSHLFVHAHSKLFSH